jgi:hypothetical protein
MLSAVKNAKEEGIPLKHAGSSTQNCGPGETEDRQQIIAQRNKKNMIKNLQDSTRIIEAMIAQTIT